MGPMVIIQTRLATMGINQCATIQLAEQDHDGCEITASPTQSSDRNVTGIHSIVNITRYGSFNILAAITAYSCTYIHS